MRLPLDPRPGTSLPPEYVDLFRGHPTLDVELPDGTAAIAVARQCDVRTVLSDNRFSRAQFGMRTLASADSPVGLVTVDPPLHTVRRRAIQGWLTTRRAQQARPPIEHVANQLIDDLLSGRPARRHLRAVLSPVPDPRPYDLLGLDVADLPYLAPADDGCLVVWPLPRRRGRQSGSRPARIPRESGDSFAARGHLWRIDRCVGTGGFREQTHRRRNRHAQHGSAHGRAQRRRAVTSRWGLSRYFERPGLADALRRNPGEIPSAVEELLRWVWFDGRAGGAAGQAHVAIADVKLHDRLISKGEVVVPMFDVANRDPDVFRRCRRVLSASEPEPAPRIRPRSAPVHRNGFRAGPTPSWPASHAVSTGRARSCP